MKKFLIVSFLLLFAISFASCGVTDPVSTEIDTGLAGSTYTPVEPDPFYFPYCEIAIEKHPEMYSTVEGCSRMYTMNEQGAHKDCLTRSSEEYCDTFITQGRQMFIDCANGTIESGCW